MKWIIKFLIILCSLSGVRSQYSLTVMRPQEMALKSLHLWNCIIQNNTNLGNKVYLIGMISELKAGRLGEVRSADFILQVGMTQFNTHNYSPLQPEHEIYKNKKFEDHIIRTNQLPNGQYTICISMYETQSNKLLATNCTQVTVNLVTPPILLSPADKNELCDPNPIFTWIPYRGYVDPSQLSYKISIVEILNQQKALTAIKTNPCFYCESFIKEPIHQLSIAFQGFKDGARYAWYVSVLEGKKEISRTEVWEFTWKPCHEDDPPVHSDEKEEETTAINNPRLKGLKYFFLYSNAAFLETVESENKNVNFYINNQQLSKSMRVTILNARREIVDQSVKPLAPGFNFFDLKLANKIASIENPYELQLLFDSGLIQSIKYKLNP
ncbi:MAG: hypothetical protein IPM92_08935 [Saprospiraceae bacterium]|nr:hypothetical protein [Saprospiraceae bacterium]